MTRYRRIAIEDSGRSGMDRAVSGERRHARTSGTFSTECTEAGLCHTSMTMSKACHWIYRDGTVIKYRTFVIE